MRREMHLFSVLIANYNNGQYLEETLLSVLKQTYSSWEIIIVDDCSTDSSPQIYKNFALDKRIKIIYNERNRGCGYTKKRCVAEAKGDICGFLDPDDALASDAIEVMVKAHEERPDYSIVYSTHYLCDSLLNPSGVVKYVGKMPHKESQLTYKGAKISHFSTFKRTMYEKTSGISENLRKAVDQDLYFKLEEMGPTYFIDLPLYYYRQHQNGISQGTNVSLARFYHLKAIFDAYKRRLKLDMANITYPDYVHYRIEYFNLIKYYNHSLFYKFIYFLKNLYCKVILKILRV